MKNIDEVDKTIADMKDSCIQAIKKICENPNYQITEDAEFALYSAIENAEIKNRGEQNGNKKIDRRK